MTSRAAHAQALLQFRAPSGLGSRQRRRSTTQRKHPGNPKQETQHKKQTGQRLARPPQQQQAACQRCCSKWRQANSRDFFFKIKSSIGGLKREVAPFL